MGHTKTIADQGLPCPVCMGKTGVRDSRATPEGSIRRRRACLTCDKRFTTVEIMIDEDFEREPVDRIFDKARRFDLLRQIINTPPSDPLTVEGLAPWTL